MYRTTGSFAKVPWRSLRKPVNATSIIVAACGAGATMTSRQSVVSSNLRLINRLQIDRRRHRVSCPVLLLRVILLSFSDVGHADAVPWSLGRRDHAAARRPRREQIPASRLPVHRRVFVPSPASPSNNYRVMLNVRSGVSNYRYVHSECVSSLFVWRSRLNVQLLSLKALQGRMKGISRKDRNSGPFFSLPEFGINHLHLSFWFCRLLMSITVSVYRVIHIHRLHNELSLAAVADMSHLHSAHKKNTLVWSMRSR